MKTQDAKHWAHALFQEVWQDLNVDKVKDYYHRDVVVDMGKQHADFEDIINRVEFIKDKYHTFRNKIIDVVAEDDKIVVCCHQWYGKQTNPDVIICIYTMEASKVKLARACVNSDIDYFQRA